MEPHLDLRRHRRFSVDMEVDCSDGKRFFNGHVLDLSEGGIKVEVFYPLEPGSWVSLSLPTRPPTKLKGMVMWSRKHQLRHQAGVRFVYSSYQQKAGVMELIQPCSWDIAAGKD